jgi:tRNA nucleotidyltransferase (CCA-adding enzyme)
VPTGIAHGTVTVKRGRGVEVTTFRSDGNYLGHRKPETVTYISALAKDLERRDFTINAIALQLSGLITDPFLGREDIKNRIIRCVGNPYQRFDEDALRMFRAIRFSAQLDFDIEDNTSEAIYANSQLCSSLSPERVSKELEKILMSKRPAKLSRVLSYGLMDSYILHPRASADFTRISVVNTNKPQRWTAFCAILKHKGLITSVEDFLRGLRLPSTTVRLASIGVSSALSSPPENRLALKRYLAEYGVDAAYCIAAAVDMVRPGSCLKMLRSVLRSGECFSMRRLEITGDDLLLLGFYGVKLGTTLNKLLNHVIENPADNNRDTLISLAVSEKTKG